MYLILRDFMANFLWLVVIYLFDFKNEWKNLEESVWMCYDWWKLNKCTWMYCVCGLLINQPKFNIFLVWWCVLDDVYLLLFHGVTLCARSLRAYVQLSVLPCVRTYLFIYSLIYSVGLTFRFGCTASIQPLSPPLYQQSSSRMLMKRDTFGLHTLEPKLIFP